MDGPSLWRMSCAFLAVPSFPRGRSASRRSVVCSASDLPKSCSRRSVVRLMMGIPVALVCGTGTTLPVLADRTGKFSTQLTAKRRYLPRIKKGLGLIRGASPENETWLDGAQAFETARDDLTSALRLFGTSFFSEGNRISPVERALMGRADEIDTAAKDLVRAVKGKDRGAAGAAYDAILKAANSYVDESKLRELIPDLDF